MSTPPKHVGQNASFGTIQVKESGKIENASMKNVGNKSTANFSFSFFLLKTFDTKL